MLATETIDPKTFSHSVLVSRHDMIIKFLTLYQGLHAQEARAIITLLRLQVYYQKVYPSARFVAQDSATSKRTFWRAIDKLYQKGLIEVKKRYKNHKQRSNSYVLTRLIVALLKYIHLHSRFLVPIWYKGWKEGKEQPRSQPQRPSGALYSRRC